MEEIRSYCVYLHEITYGGQNIGDDLTFEITIGKTTTKINPKVVEKEARKPLSHGKTANNLRLLVAEGRARATEELTVKVDVLEKDKISDKETVKKTLEIDLEKAFSQEFVIDVKAKAVGGDAPKEASFSLKFGVEPAVVAIGDSTAACTAGKYKKGGKEETSTKDQITARQDYLIRYDGSVEFFIDYKVILNEKGTVDSTKSVALFRALYFTDTKKMGGKFVGDKYDVRSSWKSFQIPIVAVKFDGDDKSKIESFNIEAAAWYPELRDDPSLKKALVDGGLKGTVDLKKRTASYTAIYSHVEDGVVATFAVSVKLTEKPKARPIEPNESNDLPFV